MTVLRAGALLSLLVVLALAAPAGGREADRVIVATAPGLELRAYDERSRVCVSLQEVGADGGSSACGPLPRLDRSSTADVVSSIAGDSPAVGGIVPPEVARVEVAPRQGEPVVVDAIAGAAYRGRGAGRVRFFLAVLPKGVRPLEVRLRGSDGTLLAVEDAGSGVDDPEPLVGPMRVGSFRAGGRTVRLEAEVVDELAPNLAEPGRRERYECLRLRAGRERDASDRELGQSCRSDDLGAVVSVSVQPDCEPARLYLSGVFEPAERSATVVLGSGRRLRARTVALPAAIGGGRAWYAVVPGGAAVRRVEVGGGEPIVLEQAPASAACRATAGSSFSFFTAIVTFGDEPFGGPVVPAVAPAPAAGPLLAADVPGGGLCLAFRSAPLRRSECVPVSRGSEGRVVVGSRNAVGGATPLKAVTASVRFSDGSDVTAPVGDPPPEGYAGAYRGRTRFFALTGPATTRPQRLTLRDAAGKAISIQDVPSFSGEIRDVRRIPGRPPLYSARLRYRGDDLARFDSGCLSLRRPRRAEDCLNVFDQRPSSDVTVECSPRRTTIVARLPLRTVTAEIVLGDGRRRETPVRAGRLVVARLPASEGLDSIVARGRRGATRLRFNLPPAARQCGYSALP